MRDRWSRPHEPGRAAFSFPAAVVAGRVAVAAVVLVAGRAPRFRAAPTVTTGRCGVVAASAAGARRFVALAVVAVCRGLVTGGAGHGRSDLEPGGATAVRQARGAGGGDLAVPAHAGARRRPQPHRAGAFQGAR